MLIGMIEDKSIFLRLSEKRSLKIKRSVVRRLFLVSICMLCALTIAQAQEGLNRDSTNRIDLKVEAGGVLATDSLIPFWMLRNNSTRFTNDMANGAYQNIYLNGHHQITPKFEIDWEGETVLGQSGKGFYTSLIQGNVQTSTRFLRLIVGMEEEFFGFVDPALSVGNLSYSNNAKPLPKVSISTNGWKVLPLLKDRVSFKAYLAHGWFEEDRFQSGAYMHQKYFYLRSKWFDDKLTLAGGVNHQAQWGGENETLGIVQPTGFDNYVRIFLGSSGGEDALQTDQNNALGNHLGSFDFSASYDFQDFRVETIAQYIFEDGSGIQVGKWNAGQFGIALSSKKLKWINKVQIDYVKTTEQHAFKTRENGQPYVEPDDYMNNSVYRSGWTYQNSLMGGPMFILLDPNIQSVRRIQNMIEGWNIGMAGAVNDFSYQLRVTRFENGGLILAPIEPPLSMFSLDLRSTYQLKNDFELSLWLNYQKDNFDQEENFGVIFSLAKRFKIK